MDNRAPLARFTPDPRFTVAAAAAAAVIVVLALLADDGPSRLLFGVAALVLLGFAVTDVIYRPRVEASADGVVVRSPLLRVVLGWHQIEAVRADTRARLGLRSTTLEIDAGETLGVFSRRSIGADPEAAAELINSFRPPSAHE